jgi:hypothetical protein
MDFKELLLKAEITKAELARHLGISPNSISMWKNKPQRYAVAYLELLIKYNRIRPMPEIGK